MRTLLSLLLSTAAFAGQSLDLNTLTGGNSPGGFYTMSSSLTPAANARFEMRVKFYGMNDGNTAYEPVMQIGVCGILRWDSGDGLLITCTSGNGQQAIVNLPGVMRGDSSEIILSLQRDATANKIVVEAWFTDGSGYTGPVIADLDGTPTNPLVTEFGATKYMGTIHDGPRGCKCEIAWVRWFSDIASYPRAVPPSNAIEANVPTLVAGWEFEGDGADRGPYGMTVNSQWMKQVSYIPTPQLSPLITTTMTQTSDGSLSLSGSAVIFSDHAVTPVYRWLQVSGPNEAVISNAASAATSAKGLIQGTYIFRLSASDDSGQTTSKTVSLNYTPYDADGFPLYPTNTLQLSTSNVNFSLAAVPGAASVDVTVTRNDGGSTTKTCTSSPCQVLFDGRQSRQTAKLQYKSASGAVLRQSTKPLLLGDRRSSVAFSNGGTHQKMSIFNYNYMSSPIVQFQSARQKYRIMVDGNNPRPYNPNVIWAGYKESSIVHHWEGAAVKDFGASLGVNYEDFYTHMLVDYDSILPYNAYIYECRDNGYWDIAGGDVGALLDDSGTGAAFTNVSDAAWDWNTGGANLSGFCGPLSDNTFTLRNTIYFGYAYPFAMVRWVFATPAGAGTTMTWQYWNGSAWTNLPLTSDTTTGLRQNGTVQWLPPSSWQETVVNGLHSKWWVRVVLSGSGNRPVVSQALGDDWIGNGKAHRGWDAAACARDCVNKGTVLEYNPNPPANATAKFKYQSRMTGLWASSGQFGNPTKVVNGIKPWKEWLRADTIRFLNSGRNGVMYDDGMGEPYLSGINFRTSSDISSDWSTAQIANFGELATEIPAAIPGSYIGVNSGYWPQAGQGAFGVQELITSANRGEGLKIYMNRPGAPFPQGLSPDEMTYENLKPENNPKGTLGIMNIWDTGGEEGGNDTCACGGGGDGWYYWDRQNRGPIAALSLHLIAANVNSVFSYDVNGWTYPQSDDVIAYGAGEGATSAAVAHDESSNLKTISGNFANIPDGFNGLIAIGGQPNSMGEDFRVTKTDNNTLVTTSRIFHDYPAGARIRYIYVTRLSAERLQLERVHHWSNWFPAVGIDVGTPLAEGDLNWMSITQADGTGEYNDSQFPDYGGRIWKREYTRALVLHRSAAWQTPAEKFDQYSVVIPLGETFYPLRADGTTGDPITTIRLRRAEGAILMKEPVN